MDMELARRLTVHPRAPRAPTGDVLLISEAPGGFPRIIDNRGLVWRQDGDGWIFDLDDDATGGVLLGMLPPVFKVELLPGLVQLLNRATAGSNGYTANVYEGPNLAHACAVALLALWGA